MVIKEFVNVKAGRGAKGKSRVALEKPKRGCPACPAAIRGG